MTGFKMVDENCHSNSNMSAPSDMDKTAYLPSSSKTSNKRNIPLTSALRSSRTSARKSRKIEENTDHYFSPHECYTLQKYKPGAAAPKVTEMNHRIRQLFPDPRTVKLPCTSARLFACFSLVAETTIPVSEDTPRRSSRRQNSERVLQPILSFLKALVHVEVSSLEVDANENVVRDRPRRIAFSGFDCSSTKPPVDRIDGSGEHQSNLINALSSAKGAMDALIMDKKNHSSVVQCLEKLIEFMTRTLTDDVSLQQACATSISPFYPIERFTKPIEQYAGEFSGIIRRLQRQPTILFVERSLNELLCNSIRYHLRLLLNPPPPRLSPLDSNYEQRSKSFSRIHELVDIVVVDEKNKEVKVDGERIAPIVNEALMQICSFSGSSNLLNPANGIATIDPDFCQSEASQRQIPRNNKTRLPPLSPVEVEELQDDMNYAFQVLITFSATRFLLNFISMPEVVSELKRLGGWGEVETYATLLWRYELWEIHPDSEHFVLLSNFKTLSERLTSVHDALYEAEEVARVSLKDLRDRFRVNATKKNKTILRQLYPEINVVDEALSAGWKAVRAFPHVRAI